MTFEKEKGQEHHLGAMNIINSNTISSHRRDGNIRLSRGKWGDQGKTLHVGWFNEKSVFARIHFRLFF